MQQLSDELTKQDGLDENAKVALYDGKQTKDDTSVNSTNDFNKQLSNAGYNEDTNGIFVNVDKTDMTNSTEVVHSLVHEQERHTQTQNGDTNRLSTTSQTELATTRGDRAATVWDEYSGLAGIETKSATTQSTWKTNNANTASIKSGTSTMKSLKVKMLDQDSLKIYKRKCNRVRYSKKWWSSSNSRRSTSS